MALAIMLYAIATITFGLRRAVRASPCKMKNLEQSWGGLPNYLEAILEINWYYSVQLSLSKDASAFDVATAA